MQCSDVAAIRAAIAQQAAYGRGKVLSGKYRVLEVKARRDGKLKVKLLGECGYRVVDSVEIVGMSASEKV